MSKNRKIGSQTKFSSSLDFHFSQHPAYYIMYISIIQQNGLYEKEKKNLSINMKIFNQKQI